MRNALLVVGVGLIAVGGFLFGKRLRAFVSTRIGFNGNCPPDFQPTGLGMAREVFDGLPEIRTWIDPASGCAFSRRPGDERRTPFIFVTDPRLVQLSVSLNPEAARLGAKQREEFGKFVLPPFLPPGGPPPPEGIV